MPIPSAPDEDGSSSPARDQPLAEFDAERVDLPTRASESGPIDGKAVSARQRPGDIARRAPGSGKADGALVPAAAATKRGRGEGRTGIGPRARKMDPIDLSAFILDSRYRTVNVVMIIFASAALVAIVAVAVLFAISRMNPESTIGLTSAGTVTVSVLALRRSARKRRREDQAQNTGDDTGAPDA